MRLKHQSKILIYFPVFNRLVRWRAWCGGNNSSSIDDGGSAFYSELQYDVDADDDDNDNGAGQTQKEKCVWQTVRLRAIEWERTSKQTKHRDGWLDIIFVEK